jgi:hypothetical protein
MSDQPKVSEPGGKAPTVPGARPAPTVSRAARIPRPPFRRLRGYAFDPSLSIRLDTMGINEIVYPVPWEPDLGKGPVGEYLEVVDYDPASQCFYEPVDLNNPHLVAQDGLAPSAGNPQFHQQLVYAVAMTTIRNFENALGRKMLWRSHSVRKADGSEQETFVKRLRIYPHALRDANAFYNPDKKALVFGYFTATANQPGTHLANGTVFACLSHDVIAHETTHALLDGIHRRFIEPTGPDALAFHEAFSDIVALFQHFSFPEVLRHQIARTRGDLASENLLGQLAQEFGVAIGNYDSLRDALGQVNPATGKWEPLVPDPQDYLTINEPHARGSILVAAVFDAFTSIYTNRVQDLLRIATSGTGVLPQGALHPDLVNRLAGEAARTAQHILLMCIRALDYCPAVNLTFGDYLRALITADTDLVPNDDRGYRVAFIEAFRRRGIYPVNVRNLAIESLVWPAAAEKHIQVVKKLVKKLYKPKRTRIFASRENMFKELDTYRQALHNFILLYANQLPEMDDLTGLALSSERQNQFPDLVPPLGSKDLFEVASVFPAQRIGADGDLLNQFMMSFTQTRRVALDPSKADGPSMYFRGGCTLILDLDTFELKYRIVKPIDDPARLERQREFMLASSDGSLRAVYFDPFHNKAYQPFALLHR